MRQLDECDFPRVVDPEEANWEERAMLRGRPHLACPGIGFDDQIRRRVVAEVLTLPVGIRQPKTRFSLSCSKVNDRAHGSTSNE